MPKFRSDLFARFRDIAEKQVPANLKLIVDFSCAARAESADCLGVVNEFGLQLRKMSFPKTMYLAYT